MLHVTGRADWADALRVECPAGGFIHLCTDAQLPFVLARHFEGRTDLVALRLDPAGLDILWAHSEPGMDPFPHLHGDLPARSVIAVEPV